MKRCTSCILPENYPGIHFDSKGVCTICDSYRPQSNRKYLGDDALKKYINTLLHTKKDRNKDYDILLALSGGRDSTFLLYYLVQILNYRVLAYSVDNGFIPKQTITNMKKMTDLLNVNLVIEKHDLLKKCVKHHIKSWMKKPSIAMIESFCVGCRCGQQKMIPDFAKKKNISVIINGFTDTETTVYRYNIMKINPNNKQRNQFIFLSGVLYHMMKNPRIFLNSNCLAIQIQDYLQFFRIAKKIKKKLGIRSYPILVSPFVGYIKWDEKRIIDTIEKELHWEKNPDVESTWRGDCILALLKLYVYRKILGFNDKDDNLSNLVRDGQITRTEAIRRIETEGEIPEAIFEEFFNNLNIDFKEFKKSISKISQNKHDKQYSIL